MIVDGKALASSIQKEVAGDIARLGLKPKLSVILVGEDPASRVYIGRKREICKEVGIRSELHEFAADTPQEELEEYVRSLGDCPKREVDAILVQLPLPPHVDGFTVLNAVPPEKDVDCFTSENVGRLAQGKALFEPCTPKGVLEILRAHDVATRGKKVAIINRSQVVGQPLSLMLSQPPHDATVTVCHEHTPDMDEVIARSDIVITAVGKYPSFSLDPNLLKKGSVVIDVAINRADGKMFGDIHAFDFERAVERTSLITPVPNGCGPLTVAMLMKNTLDAARMRAQ